MKVFTTLLLLAVPIIIWSQKTVWVTDTEGTPLSYVHVFSDDKAYSDYTDDAGRLEILAEADALLTFSYVGHEDKVLAFANINSGDKIVLKSSTILEAVNIVGRNNDKSQNILNEVETIRSVDMKRTQPQTAADALASSGNIFVQKSQMGGGSPIIRGFEANRILLVVDGVRMNNAIYRSGHLQNAITVDNAALEQVEVIYGAGSIMYGSDALGGVVHFRSKKPLFKDDFGSNSISGYTRYSSANQEKTGHVHFNLGGRSWGSFTSATVSDYGDLRSGRQALSAYPDFGKRSWYVERIDGRDSVVSNKDPYLQVGTGYRQYDVMQKFAYKPSESWDLGANFQYSTSSDVPRYDALLEGKETKPKYAEWHYGPQRRFLSSFRAAHASSNTLYDDLYLIGSYQRIHEDRINRRFRSSKRKINNETVDVFGLTADLKKDFSEKWSMDYGVDAQYNTVLSVVRREDIQSGAVSYDVATRYPSDGSSILGMGGYIHPKYKASDKLSFSGGLRYNAYTTLIQYKASDPVAWPQELIDGLKNTASALTWSLGGIYNIDKAWQLKMRAATAFRAPNIDDLAKTRIKSTQISIPNTQLAPEYSTNTDLSIQRTSKKGSFVASAYYSHLDDIIVRKNSKTPSGASFIVQDGDTLQVVSNFNADAGYIYGCSFRGEYRFTPRWFLKATASYTIGRSVEGNEERPLAHIPPFMASVEGRYTYKDHQISLRIPYHGTKEIKEYGGSSDNPELATPDGTPAWYTVDLHYDWAINKTYSLQLGCTNILDRHYRPFASGVSGAGRNFIVSLRMDNLGLW